MNGARPGRPLAEKMTPHFVREWREFRGLSQEQLAARLSESKDRSQLSKIERGTGNLTEPAIYKLAEALSIAPGQLWSDPSKVDSPLTPEERDLIEKYRSIPEVDRKRAHRSAMVAMTVFTDDLSGGNATDAAGQDGRPVAK